MALTPKRCPVCGTNGSVIFVARARAINYRNIRVTLPNTLTLTECLFCHELWLDNEEADRYSDAIDAATAGISITTK